MTLSTAGQLSDELVADRLGLALDVVAAEGGAGDAPEEAVPEAVEEQHAVVVIPAEVALPAPDAKASKVAERATPAPEPESAPVAAIQEAEPPAPPTAAAAPLPRAPPPRLAAAALLEADKELPDLPMPTPSDEGSEFSFYRTTSREHHESESELGESPELQSKPRFEPQPEVPEPQPLTPVTPRALVDQVAPQRTPIPNGTRVADLALPPIPERAAARRSPSNSPTVADSAKLSAIRGPSPTAPPRPPRSPRIGSPLASPIAGTPTTPLTPATIIAPSHLREQAKVVDVDDLPPTEPVAAVASAASPALARQRTASESHGTPEAPYSPSSYQASSPEFGRRLSRDSSAYDDHRPPSRNASVPTSVTSDSRRSSQSRSRNDSDPNLSPVSKRHSHDVPPPVPAPPPTASASALRRTSRGELRNPSVPHSPASMSSPLVHSPNSFRAANQMPPPLPVPDLALPPVPQRSRDRLPTPTQSSSDTLPSLLSQTSSAARTPLSSVPASVKAASAELASIASTPGDRSSLAYTRDDDSASEHDFSPLDPPATQAPTQPSPSTIRVKPHTPMGGNRAPPPAPVTVPPVAARAVPIIDSPNSSSCPTTPHTASTAVASPVCKSSPTRKTGQLESANLPAPPRGSSLSRIITSDLPGSGRSTPSLRSPALIIPSTTSSPRDRSPRDRSSPRLSPSPKLDSPRSPATLNQAGGKLMVDQHLAAGSYGSRRSSLRSIASNHSGSNLVEIANDVVGTPPVPPKGDLRPISTAGPPSSMASPMSINSTFSSPRSQDVAELADVGSSVSLIDAQVGTARVVSMSNGHARRIPSVDLKNFAHAGPAMPATFEKDEDTEERLENVGSGKSAEETKPEVAKPTSLSAEPIIKSHISPVDVSAVRPPSTTPERRRSVSTTRSNQGGSGTQSVARPLSLASGSSFSSLLETRPMSMVSDRRTSAGEVRPLSVLSERGPSMGIFDVSEETEEPVKAIDLNTPVVVESTTVPVAAPPAAMVFGTPTVIKTERQRLSLGSSQTSLSSKFRLPFRSPRANNSRDGGIYSPSMDDEDIPMSPTRRIRTSSVTQALRLRRTSRPTPPTSPRTRSRVGSMASSDDTHGTLPLKDGLVGLGFNNLPGLHSLAQVPSAYRTSSGGIGYSPSPTHTPKMTAEAALAQARERSLAEQAEAQEIWRRRENERARDRTSQMFLSNPLDTSRHLDRVSIATSDMMSDESMGLAYDDPEEEVSQTLSLAIVTNAGEKPRSPVEQLSASASAARSARKKDSPTTPSATQSFPTRATDLAVLGENDMNRDPSAREEPSKGLNKIPPVDKVPDAAARAKAEAEKAAKEEEDAKAEAERVEAERIAAEKAEAERLAEEKAEAERVAAAKIEAERVAAEKAEAERIAAEKAEVERKAKEEAARVAEVKRAEQRVLVRQQLVDGKADGGIMLRGVSSPETADISG